MLQGINRACCKAIHTTREGHQTRINWSVRVVALDEFFAVAHSSGVAQHTAPSNTYAVRFILQRNQVYIGLHIFGGCVTLGHHMHIQIYILSNMYTLVTRMALLL